MKTALLAAALAALATPAAADPYPYGNDYPNLGQQLFGNRGILSDDTITIRTGCGNLGMSSTGGCRRGIFGLADYNEHGTCWIDRRSGRPTCER